MRMSKSNLKSVVALLREAEDSGELKPGQTQALVRAVKELRHALALRHVDRIENAVNNVARAILREPWDR
jgi:hypothetical protein